MSYFFIMKEIERLRKEYDFPKEKPKEKPDYNGWFRAGNSAMLRMMLTERVNVILELGSLFGLSTRNMLNFAPNSIIICIDTWKGNSNWKDCNYFKDKDLFNIFLATNWELKDRIIPIKTDSISGMKIVKKFKIKPDLIYIDASHEYKDVKKDVETAKELFPQSLLCGDDYDKLEVKKAVDESGNVQMIDGFWWYN